MPLLFCSGWSCERMISVSTVLGGNPAARRDPDHFAIDFRTCEDCKKTFCDRCVARKSRAFRRPRCHLCRGGLLDRAKYERSRTRPTPEAVLCHNEGFERGSAEKYAEALNAFDRAVRLRPDYVSAHHWRGVALRQLGRDDEALAAFARVTEIDPGHVVALFDAAGIHSRRRAWDDALAALTRAVVTEPRYVSAQVNRAITLNSLGSFELSLSASETAIRTEEGGRAVGTTPTSLAQAYGAKAAALMNMKRWTEALEALDVAVDSGRDDSLTYRNRGFVLDQLGRHEEALVNYRLAEHCRRG